MDPLWHQYGDFVMRLPIMKNASSECRELVEKALRAEDVLGGYRHIYSDTEIVLTCTDTGKDYDMILRIYSENGTIKLSRRKRPINRLPTVW